MEKSSAPRTVRGPMEFARVFSDLCPGKFLSYFPLTMKLIKTESWKEVANLIFFGKGSLFFQESHFLANKKLYFVIRLFLVSILNHLT